MSKLKVLKKVRGGETVYELIGKVAEVRISRDVLEVYHREHYPTIVEKNDSNVKELIRQLEVGEIDEENIRKIMDKGTLMNVYYYNPKRITC